MPISFVLISDVGCCRKSNEDSLRYITPKNDSILANKGVLAIIADGMGGHVGGKVASDLAVNTVGRNYYEIATNDSIEALKASFYLANKAIFEAALTHADTLHGMGTTCTALVVKDYYAGFVHIGDSRLYRLRDGKLDLLTIDHTMVMDMVLGGLITTEEAHNHPDRNILSRALGTLPDVEVMTSGGLFAVRSGDVFLLCTDGLYDLVDNLEITSIILTQNTPHSAGEALISLAKERGGYDNISVGILVVDTPVPSDQSLPITREIIIETS